MVVSLGDRELLNKVSILLIVMFSLGACASNSSIDKDLKDEFHESLTNLNECLFVELNKLIDVSPEPEMAVKVASSRCEVIAHAEAQRLKDLNSNNGVGDEFAEFMFGVPNTDRNITKGFTASILKREHIEDQARDVLMYVLEFRKKKQEFQHNTTE